MTTTITPTPNLGNQSVSLRIVRDDTETTDVVAEWAYVDEASALAEQDEWTGPTSTNPPPGLLVYPGATRDLPVTAGQRYFVEGTTQLSGMGAGTVELVSTRETIGGGIRYVGELIAPSGGFDLLSTKPVDGAAFGLLAYRVTKLTDQRLMLSGPPNAGTISSWTAQPHALFSSALVATSTNRLYGYWSGASAGTVAAGALRLDRTLATTAGRSYVLTFRVNPATPVLGTSTGVVVDVLDGATVIATQDVATNSGTTVRLAFVAPGGSVTLRVKNRQPFVTTTSSVGRIETGELTFERLPSDDLSTAAYTLTTLSRTDRNGVRQVRMPRGADLVDGVLEVTDYEPALDGLLSYTAVTERVGASGTRELATASTRLDVPGNVFTQAATPQLRFAAELVESYNATNETSAVFYDVIGRPDPVVSTGVQRLRQGRLRLWFATYEDARAAITVAGRGEVILWRQTHNAGLDMYFIPGSVSSAPYDANTTPRRWYVDVDFREVATPTSPIDTDAAWNFDASGQRNATFFDSFTEFPTFADLLNGPEVL